MAVSHFFMLMQSYPLLYTETYHLLLIIAYSDQMRKEALQEHTAKLYDPL